MQAVFDSENKKPGWDEQPIDWHWFLEVQLANESETPVTIEDVQIRVRVGPKGQRKPVAASFSDGLQNFVMDMALDGSGQSNKKKYEEPRYRPVPSLMDRKIPHQVDTLVGRMLAKDRTKRFQSMEEVLAAFRETLKAIDAALVDPQRHARGAQPGHQVQDPGGVIAGVTDEDLSGFSHGGSRG